MSANVQPIPFTSNERKNNYSIAKRLLRNGSIDTDTFNEMVRTLNAQERRAVKRRQVAEQERQRKEAEAEQRRRVAEAKKEAERKNRRLIQQQAYNQKRKERRQARRAEALRSNAMREIVLAFEYTFVFKSDPKRRRYIDRGETPLSVPVNGNLQAVIDQEIADQEEIAEMKSPIIRISEIRWRITSDIIVQPKTTNRNTILMRELTALALDGDVLQHWDSKNGTCVYDFLIWRYSEIPGCKKVCTYETLDTIFTNSCDTRKIYKDCPNCVDTGLVRNICGQCRVDMSGASYFNNANDERGYWLWDNVVPYQDQNPRVDGVCVFQLELFCERIGIHMYALDEKDDIIRYFKPLSPNKHCPPLVFRVKDNHIYAILDRSRSLAQIANRKTELEIKRKPIEKMVKECCRCKDAFSEYVKKGTVCRQCDELNPFEFVLLERKEDKTPVQLMIDTMKEAGKQVFPFKNIKYDESGLKGFKLDNKQYLVDNDKNLLLAKKIAELNDRKYDGESIYSVISNLFEKLKYNNKSTHNPNAFKQLTAEGVKHRTHYGLTDDEYTPESVQHMIDDNRIICADIAKSHTSILTNPASEWLMYNFNDDFEPYKGHLVPGLYYVETDDMTLLHCDNIYSHTILKVAEANNIQFNIKSQYIPTAELLPKDYFHKLMDGIKEECKGDKDCMKPIANMISGMLGKHRTKRCVVRMNTDPAVVWDDFNTAPYHNNTTFMEKCEEFYVYGYVIEQTNVETNIPMYIQVLDENNIKLYNMIKKSGGTAVWRKTDCAMILDGKLPLIPDGKPSKPGDYRVSELPEISKLTPQKRVHNRGVHLCTLMPGCETHPDITSSSQIKEVYDILMKYKGFMNVSRAGTGKSYNIMELEKMFIANHPTGKVYKIAFTNKASLNIRGTTIHKFLKINAEGKFNLEWMKTIAHLPVLIQIDEISMIGEWLWRRLVEIKKALPNAYFVLCGDYRQAQPVEDLRDYNYFECSAVKYLANFQKIEFTVRQRYDEALWVFAEDVWEKDYTDLTKVRTTEEDKEYNSDPECCDATSFAEEMWEDTAICYLNATRKRINKLRNEFFAKQKSSNEMVLLPFENEDEIDKPIQQDAILYTGLPIIAHKNKSVDGELETANNETFVIDSIDFDGCSFTAISTRPNENGEPEEHSLTLPFEEFHNRFLLNYCTTVHKSQGATIPTGNIYIFDYEVMSKNLKYTAITRAKQLYQIILVV